MSSDDRDDRLAVAERRGTKTCSRCGETAGTPAEIVERFSYSYTERRFKSACRACLQAQDRVDRASPDLWCRRDRAKYLAGKRRHSEKYRDRYLAAGAAWRAANTERHRANARRYRVEHLDQVTERERRRYREADGAAQRRALRRDPIIVERERLVRAAWRQANPDRVRQYDRTKRAKRKGAEGDGVSVADEMAMWQEQDGRCRWCGVDLTVTGYHLDHVVAIALGGRDEPSNGCLACPRCHCRKQDLPLDEWLRRLAEESYVIG